MNCVVTDGLGLRFVLNHAKGAEAANFYRHFDFDASSFDDAAILTHITSGPAGSTVVPTR